MFFASRTYIAFEWLRYAEKAWLHLVRYRDIRAVLAFLSAEAETPEYAGHVDEERAFSNVNTGTCASACTVGKVVAFGGIGAVHIVRC